MKQSCSNKQNYFDKQRCSDKQMLKTCVPFAILEGEKKYTGILRFTLLMWGPRKKHVTYLIVLIKGEENRIES